MKKLLIAMVALSAITTSCSQPSTGDNNEETANAELDVHYAHHDKIDMNSTYTFMSISTAKPENWMIWLELRHHPVKRWIKTWKAC
jgi:ribosome-associated toxin RatA of RatAB toxin-antitoxin module